MNTIVSLPVRMVELPVDGLEGEVEDQRFDVA
jgi:hypothetical protein